MPASLAIIHAAKAAIAAAPMCALGTNPPPSPVNVAVADVAVVALVAALGSVAPLTVVALG